MRRESRRLSRISPSPSLVRGRGVVLIDADLSHPHLHRPFDLDQRLVQALQPFGPTEDFSGADDSSRRMRQTGSLEVFPAGSALQDRDELSFDRAVGRIIQCARGRADIVLVDSPPVLSGHAIALSAHVDAVVVVVRLGALTTSALEDLGWMLEASPAIKLGFVVTGDDKGESYGSQHRYGASNRRRGRPRPKPTVPPSAANGDGDVRTRRRAETKADRARTTPQARARPIGVAPSRRPAPAETRSKSAARPFGGLRPREAVARSAQSRRAKSAERVEEAAHVAAEGAQARSRTRRDTVERRHPSPRNSPAGPYDLFGERRARGRRRSRRDRAGDVCGLRYQYAEGAGPIRCGRRPNNHPSGPVEIAGLAEGTGLRARKGHPLPL
jgi:hypothetical protein